MAGERRDLHSASAVTVVLMLVLVVAGCADTEPGASLGLRRIQWHPPAGDVDVTVATVDSGVDVDHPDLNVVDGIDCTGSGGFDDDLGHGTTLAGVIAGRRSEAGAIGVVPGAAIVSVKVFDADGRSSHARMRCGLDFLAARADEIDVVLTAFSFDVPAAGEPCHDPVVARICDLADSVVIVVSVGPPGSEVGIPAALEQVLAVSALADYDGEPGGLGEATCVAGADDEPATFASRAEEVDLYAPGTCVETTVLGGGRGVTNGTSVAGAFAAGAAALFTACNPGLSVVEIRAMLLEHSRLETNGTRVLAVNRACELTR